jgi:AcrR family transcriptional regulator
VSNARGERTRRKILDAAWDLSSARGVEQVLCGVTLREVAAAAEVTPSAVSYHFASMESLALAMVEHYVEAHLARTNPEELEAIAISLEPAGREGLARLIRDAADASMATLLTEAGLEDERRFLRCRAAVGDVAAGRGAELVGALDASWVRDLAQIYRVAAESAGCRLLSPLTYEDLAQAGAALSVGLQHAWGCRPESVRPDLLGDILTAVCSAVLVSADRPGAIQELDASLPLPPASPPVAPQELLANAASVAHLFSADVDVPTTAEIGAQLACTPTELVHRFGSIRRVAAMAFARHLPDVEAATLRRPGAMAEVRLADGLQELARCVWADRVCAKALLVERLEEEAEGESGTQRGRIGDLVPLSAGLRQPLGELIGGSRTECEDLAKVMVDLVLGYGVTHPQGSLSRLTELAMRLVPRTVGTS